MFPVSRFLFPLDMGVRVGSRDDDDDDDDKVRTDIGKPYVPPSTKYYYYHYHSPSPLPVYAFYRFAHKTKEQYLSSFNRY